MRRECLALALGVELALSVATASVAAEQSAPGPQTGVIEISRTTDGITLDGELGDPGWLDATRIDRWFEVNPGDNVEPKVANVGYLAYDDRFLYAGFDFADPQPERIRAPLGDRDNVPSYTDYGGVILDTRNDGKTAQMFLANPRGIQYDAISSDVSGEDRSPDYHWQAAARINEAGWTLEMRIPFSSLRYNGNGGGPLTWRVMLYRNYPRDFRYQMFSSRLPRDVSCFVCNSKPLIGLEGLPGGNHFVAAPFVSSSQLSEPAGEIGTPLEAGEVEVEPGLDFKWIPNPDTAVDVTINPDFSQVESDVAQITANEQFALFFPEKRPFFLEGIDLFKTEIQAVYTRSFTAPSWGARVTGRKGADAYTLLVGEDRGGGSVIIPGTDSSDLADQEFESLVSIGRWRRDLGRRSFVSFLWSGREIDGGAHNRVLGPDFEWRPNDNDTISAQVLWSDSRTPDRTDLADEWDGRRLSGHALLTWWHHGTEHEDWFVLYRDIAEEFRADNGFVPQVGYRQGFLDTGYTVRPTEGFLNRVRTFFIAERQVDREGGLIYQQISPGIGMSGKKNSFGRFRLALDEIRAVTEIETESGPQTVARTFERTQLHYHLELSPSRRFAYFLLSGRLGDEVDFTHARLGKGARIELQSILRPSDRIELQLLANRRWVDLDLDDGRRGRLFTAEIARLRGVYTFNARSWLRLIGQYVATERDVRLFEEEEEPEEEFFSGSVVFAYKLNWQTVLYAGFGDERELSELGKLEPAARQLFFKVSYAFQR